MVPLEVVAFLLQGGEIAGCHEAQSAMEKNPFPFRASMLKVTVNLSPAFVRRTLLDYHVHNLFCCSRSIVDFFFPFSIPQSCRVFFPRSLDNAANLHNTTFA